MPAVDPIIQEMRADHDARQAELKRDPSMTDWLRQQAGIVGPVRPMTVPRSEDAAFRALLAGVTDIKAALHEHPQLIRNQSVIRALITVEVAEDAARIAAK